MQVLSPAVYDLLDREAKRRGVGVQELIRVLVIPDWAFGKISIPNSPTLRKALREIAKSEDIRKLAKRKR
jgi:hypothetical protein